MASVFSKPHLDENQSPLVDASFSFLTESPEIQKIDLLGSCNGLVLFGYGGVAKHTYDSELKRQSIARTKPTDETNATRDDRVKRRPEILVSI